MPDGSAQGRGSGIVDINIAKGTVTGQNRTASRTRTGSHRCKDVEFSSGEDSDEDVPRPADESAETLEPERSRGTKGTKVESSVAVLG